MFHVKRCLARATRAGSSAARRAAGNRGRERPCGFRRPRSQTSRHHLRRGAGAGPIQPHGASTRQSATATGGQQSAHRRPVEGPTAARGPRGARQQVEMLQMDARSQAPALGAGRYLSGVGVAARHRSPRPHRASTPCGTPSGDARAESPAARRVWIPNAGPALDADRGQRGITPADQTPGASPRPGPAQASSNVSRETHTVGRGRPVAMQLPWTYVLPARAPAEPSTHLCGRRVVAGPLVAIAVAGLPSRGRSAGGRSVVAVAR